MWLRLLRTRKCGWLKTGALNQADDQKVKPLAFTNKPIDKQWHVVIELHVVLCGILPRITSICVWNALVFSLAWGPIVTSRLKSGPSGIPAQYIQQSNLWVYMNAGHTLKAKGICVSSEVALCSVSTRISSKKINVPDKRSRLCYIIVRHKRANSA